MSKRRKRGVTELNLVPFIDLFSAVIIFLISTAVWDQLAQVPINLAAEDKPSLEVPPQEIRKVTSRVFINVNTETIEMSDEGKKEVLKKDQVTRDAGGVEEKSYDLTGLGKFLGQMREKYTDKKDMLVVVNDNAEYRDLITVLDQCLDKKFEDLIVTGSDQKM